VEGRRDPQKRAYNRGRRGMITLSDVIGFSDLTEMEVQTLARHEHVTPLEAVFLGCHLMQSPSGQHRILTCLQEDLEAARREQEAHRVSEIETALARFRRQHAGSD
jgi:hypothetical protein